MSLLNLIQCIFNLLIDTLAPKALAKLRSMTHRCTIQVP